MLSIFRHRKFIKQFKKLPQKVQEKFEQKLRIFVLNRHNEELNDHLLAGEWSGHRSIDITGDIRAVYKEENNLIIFKAIGTHHQLYGK